MLEKTRKIVATFKSTHDAMEAEKLCHDMGVRGRLVPIPVDITADCGLSFMMPEDEKQKFIDCVDGKVIVDGYYERMMRG